MESGLSGKDWWYHLEPDWKKAFGSTFFNHLNHPATGELEVLYQATALRFAGPRAPYANLDFELTNLSGVAQLSNLEVLVATHHQIRNLSGLQGLGKLKSLFLFSNQIESLDGIESLTGLEQLYVQFNHICSLKPLEQLTRLRELYINNNRVTSLDGLTEAHSDRLAAFFCKPNDQLRQKEMIYAENKLGIRCRGV
ncbi:leucine-rich repeat domain-containing protein [Niabella hirudinis]|uniref:leucine-rich repeat domain-containing protein n=1 Tax=Niabella hirudinis TaxID=1285929 RepID=UPI003EC0EEEF